MSCCSKLWNLWRVLATLTSCLFASGIVGCDGGGSVPPASLVGSWGGKDVANSLYPATLTVMATNAGLALTCGQNVQVSQALQRDSTGNFTASGTYSIPLSSSQTPIRFAGSVAGKVMTLTVTSTNTGTVIGTYKLTYGQQAPPFTGACPG